MIACLICQDAAHFCISTGSQINSQLPYGHVIFKHKELCAADCFQNRDKYSKHAWTHIKILYLACTIPASSDPPWTVYYSSVRLGKSGSLAA